MADFERHKWILGKMSSYFFFILVNPSTYAFKLKCLLHNTVSHPCIHQYLLSVVNNCLLWARHSIGYQVNKIKQSPCAYRAYTPEAETALVACSDKSMWRYSCGMQRRDNSVMRRYGDTGAHLVSRRPRKISLRQRWQSYLRQKGWERWKKIGGRAWQAEVPGKAK